MHLCTSLKVQGYLQNIEIRRPEGQTDSLRKFFPGPVSSSCERTDSQVIMTLRPSLRLTDIKIYPFARDVRDSIKAPNGVAESRRKT